MRAQRFKYSPQMDAWLMDHFKRYKPAQATKHFNKRFGTQQTQSAIQSRAQRIRAVDEAPKGKKTTYFSPLEAADMFSVHRRTILKRIESGAIKARKMGGQHWIPMSEVDRIAEYYAPDLPWEAYSLDEAAVLLGLININPLLRVIKLGYVDAVKRKKKRWWVRKEHIDQALVYLKQTGRSNVPWAKLKQTRQE